MAMVLDGYSASNFTGSAYSVRHMMPTMAISSTSEVTRRALYSVKTREHEYRYLPGGLLLILGKNWHLFSVAVEQSLAFFPRGCCSPHPKAFAAQFDRCLRVGD